jgi:hypothetical protein
MVDIKIFIRSSYSTLTDRSDTFCDNLKKNTLKLVKKILKTFKTILSLKYLISFKSLQQSKSKEFLAKSKILVNFSLKSGSYEMVIIAFFYIYSKRFMAL